ncbi:unnamed protein product [Brassicogethes aeneus]|uniref:Dynein heavy chain linker domain-containing protein n=1 Tax=Brassicogethes aeneus TaxID=1431903 RepID=A0A9P0BEI0_BRAAE|nr:unnamed protein product [Brassicogethes aeneus]
MSNDWKDLQMRGYYSELITCDSDHEEGVSENLLGAHRTTNILWQIKTEKHAPIVSKLTRPKREVFLAPAERWITYEEDRHVSFPVETFKPKVQLRHVVQSKELPRNVEIERRRREYQRHRAESVLDSFGIFSEQILPVRVLRDHITQPQNRFKLYSWVSYLPLELFDDTEFDPRTPDDWLQLGVVENVRYPIPAQAFLPSGVELTRIEKLDMLNNIYKWVNVAVLDYDKQLSLWTVLTLDGLQRSYTVPRIYLMFKAEDPINFGMRVKAALDLRFDAENTIRNEFFIDNMLLTDIQVDDELIERVLLLSTRMNSFKIKNQEYLERLKEEVILSYKRTQGELNFRHVIQVSDLAKFLQGSQNKCGEKPLNPKINTYMVDFKKSRKFYAWFTIYCISEAYRAVSQIVNECMRIETLSLFSTILGAKMVTLDEFEFIQKQASDSLMKQLRATWLDMIIYNTRMCLGDCGKGWYDLMVKNFDIYLISKLYRFMELIRFRMQNSLRLMIINSITLYINLLEAPCLPCLPVPENFVWGTDLRNSPFKPTAPPIFSLHMKMNEEGAYYSTEPTLFEKTLLRLYDDALTETHYIKQINSALLPNLRFAPDSYLTSLGLLSDEISGVRDRLLLAYQKSSIPLNAYAAEYTQHLELYSLVTVDYVEAYKEEQHIASEVREEVGFHHKMRENLEATLPSFIVIGPFYLHTENVKNMLIAKRTEIIKALLDMYALKMKQLIEAVLEEFNALLVKLQEKPNSIEHIFDIKDWMETIPMTIRQLDESTKRYVIEYDVLDQFLYNLPQEDFDNKWTAVGWPLRMLGYVEQTEMFLEEEIERFYKLQIADELALVEKIETMTVQVVNLSGLKDFSKVHEIAVDIRRLWKALKESQRQGQLLNQRQKLFGKPVIPFDSLNKLIKEFEPYKNLWVTASDWLRSYDIFIDNPLENIDGEALERTVNEMHKTMVKLTKVFVEIKAVQSVAILIKNQIEAFKPKIPFILALRSPGMRERHWDEFFEKTGVRIEWSPSLTYRDCFELGVENFPDELLGLAEAAGKEYAIEQTLAKMKTEWTTLEMDLQPYKETGTCILKIADEIQQLMDDHIVLTQQLSFSPFKGPFETEIEEWEETLKTTSAVAEEWMDVQKQWMYLEPIFTSPDISKHLPVETKKYKTMERTWRRIIRNALNNPNIIEYCGDKNLLESLRDCNHSLQIVQKGLTEYLETKRTVFPRLYFLSDDELLEILSQARNPLAVQPHLRKCFENIARLTFEDDLKITQMFSAEDECVDLEPTLYPIGGVEDWLLIVEGNMKNTVRINLGRALDDLYKRNRAEWVLRWPGQVVIACSQTFWTAVVEGGIRENNLEHVFNNVILVNLDALRGLVKGSLTFLQREILSALIVIEVHSRDVTQTLVELKTTNINDFDWISQLR